MAPKSFFSYFTPLKIKEVNSPINGKIEVREFLGKPRLIVKNLIQSGGLLEAIWKKGLKTINNKQLTINNILILGLGGGTAVQLVNQFFPKAKIIGVEIDPLMIQLAKKYFGLDNYKNLKIINQDAIKFCSKTPRMVNNFDLILVDLYFGDQIPEKSESETFLKNLKKKLNKKGIIIFNRLFYQQHQSKAEKYIKKLDQYFSKVKLIRIWSNLLIVCAR